MLMKFKELPPAAWASILRWTLSVTAASVAVSVAVTHLIMSTISQGVNGAGIAAAVTLPIVLGTPLIFYHLLRLQQLRLANERLQVLASTDWLTTCLNRRAFTHLVSDYLEEVPFGAFLVIDADHFKVINDHYGHDRGDEALQLMAETIMSSVRKDDVVGRLGGEEFGVFLVDASFETARQLAERIRHSIADAHFTPEGRTTPAVSQRRRRLLRG